MYKLLIVKAQIRGEKPFFINLVFRRKTIILLIIRKRLRIFIDKLSTLFWFCRIIINLCIEIQKSSR